jgi:diacylglycerol kinase family enzyme
MMTYSALRMRSAPSPQAGFAVLLNANAKQVDGALRESLRRIVPQDDLFFSRNTEEAQDIAEAVVARGYGTVFTGGGDGTFVGWVNHILDGAERRGVAAPRFGVLALGTGNAVAGVVGARRSAHVEELAAFATGAARRVRQMALLACEGKRTPFAGVGVDAAVLNDYYWLKERLSGTALRKLSVGIPGYALSAALRTAPRYLAERRAAYCEITNLGRVAYRLDGQGRQVGAAVGQGEPLYAGPCMMAAASTVPFYGFGMRAFPFAEARPGMLQLRIATELSVPSVVLNLPRIWSGEWTNPGLLDFHAERVKVQFDRPMPLQVGGDAEGWREEVTFALAPPGVEMIDFTPTPPTPPRPTLVN